MAALAAQRAQGYDEACGESVTRSRKRIFVGQCNIKDVMSQISDNVINMISPMVHLCFTIGAMANGVPKAPFQGLP